MPYHSTVYVMKEEDWFVATSIETGVASQGKTFEESLANLKEALELYYEDNNDANKIGDTPIFF
jgi:predicted RNase H-like HicB family nuclease